MGPSVAPTVSAPRVLGRRALPFFLSITFPSPWFSLLSGFWFPYLRGLRIGRIGRILLFSRWDRILLDYRARGWIHGFPGARGWCFWIRICFIVLDNYPGLGPIAVYHSFPSDLPSVDFSTCCWRLFRLGRIRGSLLLFSLNIALELGPFIF